MLKSFLPMEKIVDGTKSPVLIEDNLVGDVSTVVEDNAGVVEKIEGDFLILLASG